MAMSMSVAPHYTPDWYEGSVSETLRHLAQNTQSRTPADLYPVIEEAAGRVFIHESYMHDLYRPDARGRIPIPYDAEYIYNGYKSSLRNLMVITSDRALWTTPERTRISRSMHEHFRQMLVYIQAKCHDVKLLKDPEMARHLAATARTMI
ncbi:hypothetical protein BDV93DRAFT_514698 [Ceratobasidium sp. AG-I]|nr:hypothetical protein BDV93DRAFT_514698 [Ceratobasidium sp. AG-I]